MTTTPDDSTPDGWVAEHSVTCAICGEVADERRTTLLTTDEEEFGPSRRAEHPDEWAAMQRAVYRYGTGEAHHGCWRAWRDQTAREEADTDLTPVVGGVAALVVAGVAVHAYLHGVTAFGVPVWIIHAFVAALVGGASYNYYMTAPIEDPDAISKYP